jgi:hypothetical protein
MPDDETQSDRGLVSVVQVSSALSLGTLAGLLYSVKAVVPRIRVEVTLASVVAFVLAAAASVAFWSVVFKLSAGQNRAPGSIVSPQERREKLWLRVLAAGLGVGLLLAFIYPLKDFSSEKVGQIGFGAVIALLFLGVLALIFWKVVQFLESDGPGKS